MSSQLPDPGAMLGPCLHASAPPWTLTPLKPRGKIDDLSFKLPLATVFYYSIGNIGREEGVSCVRQKLFEDVAGTGRPEYCKKQSDDLGVFTASFKFQSAFSFIFTFSKHSEIF